jgi:serine/threonine protein kinase
LPLQGDAAATLSRPTYTNITPLSSQGNMSVVYSAHHLGFDKPCVQKVVVMANMPFAIAFSEPRLLDRLKHPNLVPVLDTQPDPHNPAAIVFTMPYYKQGSIRFALTQGYRFSLRQAIDIACGFLSAIGHLHTNGLVDRDVKSDNVLLTDNLRDGHLTDLGVAARIEADGTAPGGVGSPFFMPPESFGPGSRVSREMDIYGAGLTIHEMLSGPLPYQQVGINTAQQRLARGQRAMPESLIEFAPHVPTELRRVIRKAIKLKPTERYRSAGALIAALSPLQLVDWRQVSRGTDLEGAWEGSWPLRLPIARRRYYRVEVSPSRQGFVATALQRTSARAGWRRFGPTDMRLRASDLKILAQFFSEIDTKAAQLTPA